MNVQKGGEEQIVEEKKAAMKCSKHLAWMENMSINEMCSREITKKITAARSY